MNHQEEDLGDINSVERRYSQLGNLQGTDKCASGGKRKISLNLHHTPKALAPVHTRTMEDWHFPNPTSCSLPTLILENSKITAGEKKPIIFPGFSMWCWCMLENKKSLVSNGFHSFIFSDWIFSSSRLNLFLELNDDLLSGSDYNSLNTRRHF